jgi:hypothetical protein
MTKTQIRGNSVNYFGIGGQSAVRGSAALASTGVPLAIMHWTIIGVALMVLGGVLLVAGRLAPRFAFEPVQDSTGAYRMRFTRNGVPRHTAEHR